MIIIFGINAHRCTKLYTTNQGVRVVSKNPVSQRAGTTGNQYTRIC